VNVNAASAGQRAWMDVDGGLFTRAFTRLLSAKDRDSVARLYHRIDSNGNRPYSWHKVFPVLVADTNAEFHRFRQNLLDTRLTPKGLSPGPIDLKYLNDQSDQQPTDFGSLKTNY